MVSSLPTQAEQPKRRSNDPISWYLQNIGRVPLLTAAEERGRGATAEYNKY